MSARVFAIQAVMTVLVLAGPVVFYTVFGQSTDTTTDWPAWLGNIALGVVITPLFILLHEFGHGAAARLLGHRVDRITLGTGPRLLRIPLGWTDLHLRMFPARGLMYSSAGGVPWRRLRAWVVVAAGPGTNVAVCVALAVLVDRSALGWDPNLLQRQVDPVLAVFAINAMLAAVNIVPMKLGCTYTDGLRLVMIPFGSEKEFAALAAQPHRLAATDAREDGRYADALASVDAGLALFPTDWNLRCERAVALSELGRMETARALFEELLSDPETSGANVSIMESNVAWCLLHGPRSAASRARMDELSARAIKRLRRHPSVVGTRGAVLVGMGEERRGAALLRRALRSSMTRSGRAHNAVWLSLACARTADEAGARRFLALARTLEPDNASLRAMQDRVYAALSLPGE